MIELNSNPRRQILAVSLIVAVGIVFWLGNPASQTTFAADASAAALAQLEMLPDAPNFSLKTPDGKSIELKEFKGKAVLLSFWATWCVPCKEEMRWLVNFQKEYGSQGLVVLGLSMDKSPLLVRKFLRRNPVNFPILMASQSIADQYFVKGLPTTIYIDGNGKITDQVPGSTTHSVIENEIKLALGNGSVRKK